MSSSDPKYKPAQQNNDARKSGLNIELKLVEAWQAKAGWLWLLLPLSWLYRGISFIRRQLFKQHLVSTYRAPVPVMIVGNITIGGSGKTPLIIELVRYLQTQNVKVGVISRGYGGDEAQMPLLVTASNRPDEVGDEPCLIVAETGVLMSVCPNRQQAIECLLNHEADIQLIIADDGLQHYKLERDIEWIVVDSTRGFGNNQLLPTGFLREPLSRLKEATTIYHQPISKAANLPSDLLTMYLEPAELTLLHNDNRTLSQNKNDKNRLQQVESRKELEAKPVVYGVSGIGYPKRFFNTLRSLGFTVIELPMPDHHQFTVKDLIDLTEYPIVITSKDAVKIAPLIQKNPKLTHLQIWVLPVHAILSDNCYQTLIRQLQAVGVNI